MLGLIINSMIRGGENPTPDQFEDLAREIESDNLFQGVPRRFIVQREQIGRLTIDRTKSIFRGNTVYTIYEHEHNPPKDYDPSNTRIGYEFHVSDEEVTKVYKKSNLIFFNGSVELCTAQRRFI